MRVVVRLGQVDGGADVPPGFGGDVPHGTAASGHQLDHGVEVVLPGHAVVGLVAHLHHAHVAAVREDRGQGFAGVFVQRLGFFSQVHALPRLRRDLAARIGPEIGIVEVHQRLHAVCRRPGAERRRHGSVAVAAAVAVAVGVEGIVPHAHADVGDARVGQYLQRVGLVSGGVIVFHAAGLLGDQLGDVHTEPAARVLREGGGEKCQTGQRDKQRGNAANAEHGDSSNLLPSGDQSSFFCRSRRMNFSGVPSKPKALRNWPSR